MDEETETQWDGFPNITTLNSTLINLKSLLTALQRKVKKIIQDLFEELKCSQMPFPKYECKILNTVEML